jgi:NAD-dependent SIR2 family protein deacetylase
MSNGQDAGSMSHVAELLAGAEALLVTAGAGMGVDSGLPDFRSPQGFWRAYPPLAKLGISFEQMAQPHWFDTRPGMAWAWYGHRQQLYRETTPHAGFTLLRRWAQVMRAGHFVATSNVDGQFQAAGFAPERVLELHGSVHRLQCTSPCSDETWEAGPLDLKIDLATLHAMGTLPRCPQCGGLARPNVLMFNDGAWIEGPTRDQEARFAAWLSGLEGRLVVIECGAGRAIATIRRLGEEVAARFDAPLVRINPDATQTADVIALPMPALQALNEVQAALGVIVGRRNTRPRD